MTDLELIAQQDALRTARQFIGVLGAWSGADQSFAGEDAWAYNPPGQFTVTGPGGVSIEGRPLAVTRTGAVVIPPGMVMLGLGAALVLLLKKG